MSTRNMILRRAHRDNHIFKRMSALLEPGISQESAASVIKEVVQRVGRGAVADFARTLCCRVTCRILPTEVCDTILTLLRTAGTDDQQGQALMDLVIDAASANPYIFVPLSHQASALPYKVKLILSAYLLCALRTLPRIFIPSIL